MSYEIIEGTRYPTPLGLPRTDIVTMITSAHTVIQDIESFFWVLVYLCLTRKGPGGARRDEFNPDLPTASAEEKSRAARVRGIVMCLFDSPNPLVIKTNKLSLFGSPTDFETDIQEHFHPYFNPLKRLLSDWWRLLQITYNTYDDIAQGTLHDAILEFLDEALTELRAAGSDTAEERAAHDLMQAEMERRRLDLARYAAFPDEPEDLPAPSTLDLSPPPKLSVSPYKDQSALKSHEPPSPVDARASKRARMAQPLA